MTISVKPEDIDSPEAILHYMDQFPLSGQNRAAAKLIRELLTPSAPLVAVSDNADWTEDAAHENGNYQCQCSACDRMFLGHKRRTICKLCAGQVAPQATVALPETWRDHMVAQGYTNDEIEALRPDNESARNVPIKHPVVFSCGSALQATVTDGMVKSFIVDFHANNTDDYAGKIKRALCAALSASETQATVEPLTDERILSEWDTSYNNAMSNIDGILAFARSILALATPPTSKATEQIDVQEAWLAAGGNPKFPANKDYLLRALKAMDSELSNRNLATSKADTGEAIRNEQESFEKWLTDIYEEAYGEEPSFLKHDGSGNYYEAAAVQNAWSSWQARANFPQANDATIEQAVAIIEALNIEDDIHQYVKGNVSWELDRAVEKIRALHKSAMRSSFISIQDAWIAAGGNPRTQATKQELLETLKCMNEAVDHCDDAHGKSATPSSLAPAAEALPVAAEIAQALIDQFYDGTAEKDWPAWGAEIVGAIESRGK